MALADGACPQPRPVESVHDVKESIEIQRFLCAWQVCQVTWSGPHQGLDGHVERYRNSPVMHKSHGKALGSSLKTCSGNSM